jgi:hypothetical protein
VWVVAALAVGICSVAAWNGEARTGVATLVAAVIALAVACGGLAGYVIWLRRLVVERMAVLLAPYLPAVMPAADDPRSAHRSRSVDAAAFGDRTVGDLLTMAAER